MPTIVPPPKGLRHPLLIQRMTDFLPLPAFIELDLSDRVVRFTAWERNAEPTYVTLGHARRWEIDVRTSRRAASELAQEFEPLFVRLCDGYVVDWNGRDHVGVLSDDAQAAASEVSARLESKFQAE